MSVGYAVVDDEPAYRGRVPPGAAAADVVETGSYPSVEAYLALHRDDADVVVLDLTLNRATGDAAVLQGVRAVRQLTELGRRVVIHTADERPEPVARCVAAGAAAYVSKYAPEQLAPTIAEVAEHGRVVTPALSAALEALVERAWDVRLSAPVEETLRLLGKGLTDAEVARRRCLSVRTVEDHKRKVLEELGTRMEREALGFEGVSHQLGIDHGDLVNDEAGARPARGVLGRLMPWTAAARGRRRS